MGKTASPQKENGFTPIANEIIEQLAKIPLNGTQWRIMAVVWRYTYGFSRKGHELSLNFIANAINCPKTQVKREIDRLIGSNILTIEKEASFNQTRTLSFNKDYTVYQLDDSTLIRVQDTQESTEQYANQSTEQYANQSTKKEKRKLKENVDSFFESVWAMYPNKRGKNKVGTAQKKELLAVGIDELTRAINRYKAELAKETWRSPQNGSTFFNGSYIDYLDANYQPGGTGIQKPVVRFTGEEERREI